VKEVEALERQIVATQADVRDYAGLKQALDDGVTQLGRLDIVCSNADFHAANLPLGAS
jgi:(+)-trans-carveol dehydrogenase